LKQNIKSSDNILLPDSARINEFTFNKNENSTAIDNITMLCVTATVPQDIIAIPLILLSMQRKVINLPTPGFYPLLPTGIMKDNKSQPINECIVRHEFTHAIIHQVNTAPKK
jgi:hypothetical protein